MPRIQELKADEYERIKQVWLITTGERFDNERAEEVLDQYLFEDGTVIWYTVTDKTWFIIKNVIPRLGASFYMLSLDEILPLEKLHDTLREVMRDYDLRRLTAIVPSPVHRIQNRLYKTGFAYEGRMKDASLYDNAYTDVLLYGFYRGEVEKGLPLTEAAKAKKRRRRRRSRRKRFVEAA